MMYLFTLDGDCNVRMGLALFLVGKDHELAFVVVQGVGMIPNQC